MSDRTVSENNNDNNSYDGPIEEIELDLLVDGELDEPRRRELLARLEAAPEGWRRCALAFLEAQSFREALFGAKADAAPAVATRAAAVSESEPPPVSPSEPDRSARRMRHTQLIGAMAASFLVAVGVVWIFRGGGDSGARLMPPIKNAASEVAVSPAKPTVTDPASPGVAGNTGVPGNTGAIGATGATGVASEPWHVVNVSSPDADGQTRWQFPAVERATFDRGDVDRLSGGAPIHFVKSLEDSGHRLKRSRSYVPVRLRDGRNMVVPVDDYNVTREFPRFQ